MQHFRNRLNEVYRVFALSRNSLQENKWCHLNSRSKVFLRTLSCNGDAQRSREQSYHRKKHVPIGITLSTSLIGLGVVVANCAKKKEDDDINMVYGTI